MIRSSQYFDHRILVLMLAAGMTTYRLYDSIKMIFYCNSISPCNDVVKRLSPHGNLQFGDYGSRNRRSENNRDTVWIYISGAHRCLPRKSNLMPRNRALRDTDCTPRDSSVRRRTGFLRTVELFRQTELTGVGDSY